MEKKKSTKKDISRFPSKRRRRLFFSFSPNETMVRGGARFVTRDP